MPRRTSTEQEPTVPDAATEPIQWQVQWRIDKYRADDRSAPYAVVEGSGNLLVYGGASALWPLRRAP